MSNTPTFGQVYHTADGKTVYFDPKSKQVSVFEGLLTLDKIIEPDIQAGTVNEEAVEFILKKLFPMGTVGLDIIVSTQPGPTEVDLTDILGPKNYYILVPEKDLPLCISAGRVSSWVSEHKQGHHPVYHGFIKHRILSEQFDWLRDHKQCSVRAWYGPECPAFVSLACLDHAKSIQPVSHKDATITPVAGLLCETSTVESAMETVLTEERDV